MAHRRADARQFVGGNRRANAAAADEHPSICLDLQDRFTDSLCIVRIIHWILIHGAEVDHRVAQLMKIVPKLLFEGESGVIRTDGDVHFYFSNSPTARCTTWSTVKPSFSITTFPGAEAPNRSIPMTSPRSPT